MLHSYLLEKMPKVVTVCRKHNVQKLYAFGSIVDNRFIEGKSDIDLLVELPKLTKEKKYKTQIELWFDLQEVLNCEVDLVIADKVKGKYFKKYLEIYKELIYEQL